MNDCLFCKIVSGEIPSEKIYEDEYCLAFLDITPVNQGHTLLVPKKHSRNLLDMDTETICNISPALIKLSKAIKESVKADGINIHMNNESPAGQVIFHSHIHIIPRFSNDGLKMWHGRPYPNDELKKVAEIIKKTCVHTNNMLIS